MIALWKYESAPKELRNLQRGQNPRSWVLSAPASLSVIVEAFLKLNRATHIHRHEMADGTVVFFCPDANQAAAYDYHASRAVQNAVGLSRG